MAQKNFSNEAIYFELAQIKELLNHIYYTMEKEIVCFLSRDICMWTRDDTKWTGEEQIEEHDISMGKIDYDVS